MCSHNAKEGKTMETFKNMEVYETYHFSSVLETNVNNFSPNFIYI